MKHLVISVHGIRTFGGWQERLERLLSDDNSDRQLTVINYKYGYFSVVAFLIPFLRWLVVRRFRYFLAAVVEGEHPDRVDLVGHSFGTHIIGWGLYGLPHLARPQVNSILFAGSVLKSNFPWQVLIGRSVQRVINDCGVEDDVLIWNQILVLFTGMAGRLGFNGGTGRTLRNRFFDYGHSGYFLTDGRPDDSFMRRYWVPLLLTSSEPELVDARKGGALGGIQLTLLNNAEPIKLLVYIAPFILLTLYINHLYQTADAQRDRAEKALHEVVSTTNDLVFNLSRKLEDRQGIPQSLVVDVLKEARRPLDALIVEANTNAQIAISRSLALTQLSTILREQEDVQAAREAAKAAVAQLDIVQAGQRDNPAWLEAHRGAYERLASSQLEAGDVGAAFSSFAISLDAALALAQAAPQDFNWSSGLAAGHSNMGDILVRMARSDDADRPQRLNDAERHYKDSLDIREKAAAGPSTTSETRRDYAAAIAKFGDLDLARGDRAGAKDAYSKSLKILEPLAREHPQNTQLKRDLAVCYQEIANASTDSGEAVQWLREDLNIAEELAKSEPERILWQHDLISSYDRLASRLADGGEPEEALKLYRKSLEVSKRIVERDKSRPVWQREMALTLGKIAEIEAKGDAEKAVAEWRRAIAVREALPQPLADPDWQRELVEAWLELSDQLRHMGRVPEALSAAESCVAAARALPEGNEKSTLVARALGTMAWAAVLADEPRKGVEGAREAVKLAPQLSWIKLNLAHALMFSGVPGATVEAKGIYLEGLAQTGEAADQWKKSIRDDFAELRKQGLAQDLMKEVELAMSN
jgi:tetratricopeptide (TPR) repeat protein